MIATILQNNDQFWVCQGDWNRAGILELTQRGMSVSLSKGDTLLIDGRDIQQFDSAGALWLYRLQQQLARQQISLELQGFAPSHERLLQQMYLASDTTDPSATPITLSTADSVIQWITQHTNAGKELLAFIGELCVQTFQKHQGVFWLRVQIFLKTIIDTGYHALPIIGLLSFLIGVVLVYQLSIQLRQYNATIYIVNLLGIAVFREFGSLLTAVVAAGRTSASFTAEIGTMKIRQELEALSTMGVKPMDILVLPKILGLMVALPILTAWSDIFAILGGLITAHFILDISYLDFLSRFQQTMTAHHFWIGLLKAPVFAMIIATVGCFRGFAVGGSAESVGEQTTRSVVQAIFLIIVSDAIFSVLFSSLGI